MVLIGSLNPNFTFPTTNIDSKIPTQEGESTIVGAGSP